MRTLTCLMMLFAVLASPLMAEELQPFTAEYRVYISKIPTPIKARLTLEALEEPDLYQIELKAKSLLLRNTEISQFYWNECQPKTNTYRHEFRGFGARRHHDMIFRWSPPSVDTINEEDEHESYEIPEQTLDELTLLLKARCAFADGAEQYLAYTAYGDDLKEHVLEIVDREEIKTPAGRLDTLVIRKQRAESSERSTYFWIAPELDYMLVKAKHVENPALFGELILREFSVNPDQAEAGDEEDEPETAPAPSPPRSRR